MSAMSKLFFSSTDHFIDRAETLHVPIAPTSFEPGDWIFLDYELGCISCSELAVESQQKSPVSQSIMKSGSPPNSPRFGPSQHKFYTGDAARFSACKRHPQRPHLHLSVNSVSSPCL